jgi:hypothetical protein
VPRVAERDGAVVLRCHHGETSRLVLWMEGLLTEARKTGRVRDATFIQSSAGRHHMALLGTELARHAEVLQRDAPWLPLVGASHASASASEVERQVLARTVSIGDSTSSTTPHRTLALAQLLDSRPQPSQAQIWHADNSLGGYTVLVAMCDVTKDNGPTSLQLGSHHTVQSPTITSVWNAWRHPTRIAHAQLNKGDVLVYSSALLHRGESNCSDSPRPVCVFRCVMPSH